jgi:hypothetical protein
MRLETDKYFFERKGSRPEAHSTVDSRGNKAKKEAKNE